MNKNEFLSLALVRFEVAYLDLHRKDLSGLEDRESET
jgi:hypothetical protein